jgi:ABC-type nitrate/sulfonate/bicarbonate transport system permease component
VSGLGQADEGRRTSALAPGRAATPGWPLVGRTIAGRIDVLGVLGLLLFVVVWQLLTYVIPRFSLPTPLQVAQRVVEDFILADYLVAYGLPATGLLDSMLYTTTNVLIAVVIGGAVGTLFGLITARFELARAILDPVTMTAGTVPILVLAPFFLIWFGIGRLSSVLLVVIYVVVILYIYAQRAADNLDPVYEDAAYTLGASPRRAVWDVLVPGTVPQILGGIRIALAGAWGLEAIAELLGSQHGIGKIVQVLAGSTDILGIFAALLVLGVVAVLFDALAALLFSHITAWSVAARTSGE